MNLLDIISMLDTAGFEFFTGILTVLWQSTAILAICLGTVHLLRRYGAGLRFTILAGSLIVLPLLPVANVIITVLDAPTMQVAIIPYFTSPDQPTPVPHNPSPLTPPRLGTQQEPFQPQAISTPSEPSFLEMLSPVRIPWAYGLILYMSAVLYLLCSIVIGTVRIRRWIRAGEPVTDARSLALIGEISTHFAIGRTIAAVESDYIVVPFVYGFRWPVLALPIGFADGLDDDEHHAVLVHEFMHVRRGDTLLLPLLAVIRALFWFHPLVWTALRESRLMAENACDEAVVAMTGASRGYASLLARMAETLPSHSLPRGYAAGLFTRHSFRRRVESILAMGTHGVLQMSRKRALVSGAMLAVVLLPVLAMRCAQMKGTHGEVVSEKLEGRLLHITGRVVHDGQPVAGAELYAMPRTGSPRPSMIPIVAVSGRDGAFVIDMPVPELFNPIFPGSITVIAHHPEHSIGWMELPITSEMTPVTVELQEPQSIIGIVTDKDGRPVSNALVAPYYMLPLNNGREPTLEMLDSSLSSRGLIEEIITTTDSRGRFTVRNLPENYDVSFSVSGEGYARIRTNQIPSGSENIWIVLIPEGIITGRVYYSHNGKPAAGIHVMAQGIDWPRALRVGGRNPDSVESGIIEMGEAWTDSDGYYTMGALKGWIYNVWLDDTYPKELPDWVAAAAESVKVVSGETTEGIDLVFVKGGFIRGTVTDRDTGELLEGVTVGFKSAARPESAAAIQSVITDKNGEYRFRAVPGVVHVYLAGSVPPGYRRPSARYETVTVVEGGEITGVNLQLVKESSVTPRTNELPVRQMHITGRVVHEGQPVVGVELYAMPRNDASHPFSLLPVVTRSGGDGSFAFDVPAPEANTPLNSGAISVIACHPDHSIGWATVIDSLRNGPVEITLQEAATVTGIITDETGKPLENVRVIPYTIIPLQSSFELAIQGGIPLFGHIEALNAITDNSGRFRIGNMPPMRNVNIMMMKEGYAQQRQDTITSGDFTYHFALRREGIIRGRITYTSSGEPAAGVQIVTQGITESTAGTVLTTSDKEGNYAIHSLQEGLYNVMLYNLDLSGNPEWTGAAAESVMVRAGKTVDHTDIRLVKGGMISGRVTGRDTGEPLEGVLVGFYDASHPRSTAAMQGTYTDADGAYRFRAAPGNVRVYLPGIVPPGYERSNTKIDVVIGEGETLTRIDFQLVKE